MKAAGEGGRTAGSWDWRRMGDGLRQKRMDKEQEPLVGLSCIASLRTEPRKFQMPPPSRKAKHLDWSCCRSDGFYEPATWPHERRDMVYRNREYGR